MGITGLEILAAVMVSPVGPGRADPVARRATAPEEILVVAVEGTVVEATGAAARAATAAARANTTVDADALRVSQLT